MVNTTFDKRTEHARSVCLGFIRRFLQLEWELHELLPLQTFLCKPPAYVYVLYIRMLPTESLLVSFASLRLVFVAIVGAWSSSRTTEI